MTKLRISYTLLNYWNRNDTEGLINYYFKLKPFEPTPAMLEGIKWDKANEKEVRVNSKLIPEFGGIPLQKPIPQEKLEADIDDFTMVAVLDVLVDQSKMLIETKVGKTSPPDWLKTYQVPMQMLACELKGIQIEKGLLIRYNPKEPVSISNPDWMPMYNSKELMDETKAMIVEKGNLIYKFFKDQGLL